MHDKKLVKHSVLAPCQAQISHTIFSARQWRRRKTNEGIRLSHTKGLQTKWKQKTTQGCRPVVDVIHSKRVSSVQLSNYFLLESACNN